MARFRIDRLAELARQMSFTPARARLAQVDAAQALLESVDPLRAYPIEYLVYRITGYHPPSVEKSLLAGLAVQHDLGLLIESVSDTLDLRAERSAEPVLQIGDVCDRFAVTSKTVQRWRRRGLAARRFVFPDNKRRVGFLLSSVERYLQATRGLPMATTAEGAVSSSASAADRTIRLAGRLSAAGVCIDDLTRRVSRRTGRSPLAVLHALKSHDREQPDAAILPHTLSAPPEEDAQRIVRAFRRRQPISTIASELGLTRGTVYGVLLRHRVEQLIRRKAKFIDDTLYHSPDAESQMQQLVAQQPLGGDFDRVQARVPRDLPPYLADLYRTPLLGAARERALFLKLNFHKYQFAMARRRFEPDAARWRDCDQLDAIVHKINDVKNAIVRANLRLVVGVARKHASAGLSLMDLVSDGNVVLLRAVDGFDAHRGHRFSTYATLALYKGFARSVPATRADRTSRAAARGANTLADVADRSVAHADRTAHRDHLKKLLEVLAPHERQALLEHFGVGDPAVERFGKSAARAAAKPHAALAKVRAAINDISAA